MRDDRPVNISQSANSNIPIDTTPMVIRLLLLHSARTLTMAWERIQPKSLQPDAGHSAVWWVCNRAWGRIKDQLKPTSGSVPELARPRELCARLMEISNVRDGCRSGRSGVWTPEEITVW